MIGNTVDEDVGTVELCVSYRGDNVPPTVDATIYYNDDCKCIPNYSVLVMCFTRIQQHVSTCVHVDNIGFCGYIRGTFIKLQRYLLLHKTL